MKIFVPDDLVAAVGLLHRLGAQQAEIRAALRLGEIHGAGPLARHHLRQEHLLLIGLAVHQQRRGRAHGQAAIHRKRHVGRALEFGDDLAQRHRQALPAIFGRRRQPEPAAFGDLLEGFLETLRRGDAAVIAALAAFEIADAIERLQHFFAQLGRLVQNRLADIGGGIGKAGKIVVAVDLEHVVEQKAHIFHGGFVGRHGVLPAGRTDGFGGGGQENRLRGNGGLPGMDLIRFRTPDAAQSRSTLRLYLRRRHQPAASSRRQAARPSGDAAG